MKAAFFAMGRGVDTRAGLDEVRQVDLAVTVAALLEVAPPRRSPKASRWSGCVCPSEQHADATGPGTLLSCVSERVRFSSGCARSRRAMGGST